LGDYFRIADNWNLEIKAKGRVSDSPTMGLSDQQPRWGVDAD